MSGTDAVARLKQLLDYVAATERDKLAIPTDVAGEKGFRIAGSELMMLPGVQLNGGGEGDPLWVRVERLTKVKPPRLADAELGLWADVADDPDRKPALKSEVPIAALRAAGLIEDSPVAGEPVSMPLNAYPGLERLRRHLDAFVREVWTPWADEERARRRSIKLYNDLFALRLALDGSSDTPAELVCGIGMAEWKRPLGRLSYPLLTVQLEVSIEEASHAIELRPRSESPPGVESDTLDKLDIAGVDEWRRFTIPYLEGLESGVSPFVADGFDPVLRKAVQLLDPSGVYLPDLREGQQPDPDSLRVGPSWLIFSRARRATQVMADLQRLTDAVAAVDDSETLPGEVLAVVSDPSDAIPDETPKAFRGVSTVPGVTTSDGSGADLYFPKPFNAEQVEVIQRLEARAGVVVQGPPGTGKTHTIANVVSHYLALGKRVLVTSQKAPALRVLRDKLPLGVRPLAVSLLDSDREGLQQFQDSVNEIAARLQRIKPREAQRQIAELQSRIDRIHAELAALDRKVDQLGREGLSPVELDGRRVAPVEAARALAAAGDLPSWFEDSLDVIRSHVPSFSDEDIAELREARKQVGERIAYVGATLPPPEALPSPDAVEQLHEDLSEAEQLERAISPPERLADGTTAEALALGASRLDAAADARSRAEEHGFEWLDKALALLRRGRRDVALEAIEGLAPRIEALCEEARHFLTLPVTLPEGSDEREFRDPIANLAVRGELGIFTSLFARQVKQRLGAVRIAGRVPNSASDWAGVKRYLEAGDAARELISVWNHAASASILSPVSDNGLRSAEQMKAQLEALALARAAVECEQEAERAMSALLPHWSKPVASGLEDVRAIIDRHLRRTRLAEGRRRLAAVQGGLAALPGMLGDRFRTLAHDRIGRVGEPSADVSRQWRLAVEELGDLRRMAPAFMTIASITREIEESGAPRWARKLRETPVTGVEDALTPGDWRERWRLKRLATWLDRIDAHDRIRALAAKRSELETQLARAYEEVIEVRTWCALAEKATDQVRAALTSYA